MAVTYTSNLNLGKHAAGDLSWHTVVNANYDLIDTIIAREHTASGIHTDITANSITVVGTASFGSIIGNLVMSAGATVAGVDLPAHVANVNAHHAQSHTIGSHSDTSATGAQLNTLVGGVSTTLHYHDTRYYTKSELNATTSGTAGADFIGSTSTFSLLSGSTVQDILESIDSYLLTISGGPGTTAHTMLTDMPSASNSDHDGRYYTQSQTDMAISTDIGTHSLSGDHDGRYYTKTQSDSLLLVASGTLSGALDTHKTSGDHDGRYYTETEVDSLITTTSGGLQSNINNKLSLDGSDTMTGAVKSNATTAATQTVLQSFYMSKYADGLGLNNTGMYFNLATASLEFTYLGNAVVGQSIAGAITLNGGRQAGAANAIYFYGTSAGQDGSISYSLATTNFQITRPLLLNNLGGGSTGELYFGRLDGVGVNASLKATDGNMTQNATGSIIDTAPVINHNINGTTVLGTDLLRLTTSGTNADSLHEHSSTGISDFATAVPEAIGTVTTEPNGFVTRAGSTLSFNNSTRELTISGTYTYYYRGTRVNKVGADSVQLPTASGISYIYFDASEVLQDTQTEWEFNNSLVFVATVYWDGTTGLVGDERHGISMDNATHEWAHHTIGTRYESGFAGTFDDTSMLITVGNFHDEDIMHDVSQQTQCRVLYRNGGACWNYTAKQNEYFKQSAGPVLQYDNAGVLTEVPVANYMAMWVFVTNDPDCPIYSLMGQRVDATLANARANNVYTSLSFLTLPFAEMKLLYRVIIRRNGASVTYIETVDYRNVAALPSSTYVATSHSTLTGLTNDDHTQYALADGSRAFTGPITVQGAAIAGSQWTTLTNASNADSLHEHSNTTTASGVVLTTDVIRHTVTAGEALAGSLSLAWNTCTKDKVVALSAVTLYAADGNLYGYTLNTAGVYVEPYYDGSSITVGGILTENDVITVKIEYEI